MHAWKSIDRYIRRCTGLHVPDLRLPKVRLYPRLTLDQRQHLRSRADHLAWPHLAFADNSALGRVTACVVQIGSGCVEGCLFSMQVSNELPVFRIEHRTRSRFGEYRGLITGEAGLRL